MKKFAKGCDVIAVDTETTGLDAWHDDRPFAISMCDEEGRHAYWETEVDPFTRQVSWSRSDLSAMRRLLEDPKLTKVFHNAKFDIFMLERIGIEVKGVIDETTFMAHACNSLEPSYGLKQLSLKYGGYEDGDQKSLQDAARKARHIGKKRGWKLGRARNHCPPSGKNKAAVESDYWMVSILEREGVFDDLGLVEHYAVLDAERTMFLKAFYDQVFSSPEEQWQAARRVYEREMRDLWPVVVAMEKRGVRLRLDAIEQESARAVEEMEKEKKWIMQQIGDVSDELREAEEAMEVGLAFNSDKEQKELASKVATLRKIQEEGFNLRSSPHMRWLLYDRIGLPVTAVTAKKGEPKVNWEVMATSSDEPVLGAILRYRSHEKNKGSFLDNYSDLKCPDPLAGEGEWCLHPNFFQVGPATGRFACRQPNLQNVGYGMTAKSRGVVPFSARVAFGPRRGYRWYFLDYKQLEARLFADVAQEPLMLEAFRNGRDLHSEMCNKAFGGRGNPRAIRSARFSMCLDARGIYPDDYVLKVWHKYKFAGLKELPALRAGEVLSHEVLRDADRVAKAYLDEFEWDIVALEKSLGEVEVSRNKTKTVTFLRIFGGGVDAFARQVKCTREEAQDIFDDYSRQFERVDKFIKEATKLGRRQGYVINKMGRRLSVDPEAPYRACNYLIQSYAADLLKRAMVRLHGYFRENEFDAYVLLTIHDELILEIAEKHCTVPFLRSVKRIMEDNRDICAIDTPVDIDRAVETWECKTKVLLP